MELNQEQMAERLLISANYLSQIENGREPSVRVLETFRRLEADHEADVVIDEVTVTGSRISLGVTKEEGLKPLPSAADIEADCRAHLERFITAARKNVRRLGWIQGQLETSLAQPPPSWAREDRYAADAKRTIAESGSEEDEDEDESTGVSAG